MFHNIHGAGWPLEIVKSATDYCPTSWILHDCSSFLGSLSIYESITFGNITVETKI